MLGLPRQKKEKCNGFRAAKGFHVFAAWPMRRKQNGLSPSSPWPTGWTERRGNAAPAPSGRQPEAQDMAYALRCRQPRARTRDGSPKGGDSLLAPCGAKRNTTARSAKGRCAKTKREWLKTNHSLIRFTIAYTQHSFIVKTV